MSLFSINSFPFILILRILLVLQTALYALSALINAMKELDVYAITRKVYRDNLAPRLGVLLPKISETSEVHNNLEV